MTAGRVTTRAGRKIRQVAPGHVVDVATGSVMRRSNAGYWNMTLRPWWWPSSMGDPSRRLLATTLRLLSTAESRTRAEAVCALMRALVAIGGRS